MGKTIESLIESRIGRERILAHFGGELPESIMRHDRSVKAIDFMSEERSYDSCENTGGHTGKLGKSFGSSGRSCRGVDGALSRFPQNVGRKLLLFYTNEGDTVVDPFAGHNSRMELCWRANRNYRGNDISDKFQTVNRKILALLESERGGDLFGAEYFKSHVELTLGDSRHLPYADSCGDFTITSPPYWDLEQYGTEPEQLGIGQTYSDFLSRLGDVAKENYRVLVNGAFCVWCVNDFRKNGKFYNYHCDTINLMLNAGFTQHDIAITDLGTPIRSAFATQTVESKILPKRHEYCLVFRKV